MLVRLLKANHFYNILLVPLVGILFLLDTLKIKDLLDNVQSEATTPLCQSLCDIQLLVWEAVLINFGIVIVICYLLLIINARFAFLQERTFLPLYIFIFIAYAFPSMHILHPVFIAAVFILLAIRSIFYAYDKKEAISNSFDAGFLTGVAAIFYLPAILLIFLVPLSISTLRNKATGREKYASFIGLILVWLFYATYYFVTNNFDQFINLFNNAVTFADRTIFLKIPVIVYLSVVAIITILASFFILTQYDSRKISTRRYIKILAYYFYGSLALMAVPSVSIELIILPVLPLSFLITNYLILMRRRFWADLFLIVLILSAVVLQFLLR